MESWTDIRVDEMGRWWNGDSLLVNEGTLAYFKANLHRTDDGRYYILNRFGERSEVGWLQSIDGFPLFAEQVSLDKSSGKLTILLDNGRKIDLLPSDVFIGGDDLIWVWAQPQPSEDSGTRPEQTNKPGTHPDELPIPARLKPRAMTELAVYLTEGGNGDWHLSRTRARLGRSPSPFLSHRRERHTMPT